MPFTRFYLVPDVDTFCLQIPASAPIPAFIGAAKPNSTTNSIGPFWITYTCLSNEIDANFIFEAACASIFPLKSSRNRSQSFGNIPSAAIIFASVALGPVLPNMRSGTCLKYERSEFSSTFNRQNHTSDDKTCADSRLTNVCYFFYLINWHWPISVKYGCIICLITILRCNILVNIKHGKITLMTKLARILTNDLFYLTAPMRSNALKTGC